MDTNGPTVRVIIQQCLSARLQVQPPGDSQAAEYVKVRRGVVLYLCFLKGATLEIIPKVVKAALNVKLSECGSSEERAKVSVLDLPGDVLIVPQATLGGKLKGKSMQYHSNISKEDALSLYQEFVQLVQELVTSEHQKKKEQAGLENRAQAPKVNYGTYGKRQVLSVETNGPYTHVLDF
ncbi:D-aminoacyl-tRNA deacylase 2 [Nematostella vectensis]|uniref:D-aminoacyl-tRNA deacylase 2 n=1 Tax=Nematostella vectensis TaxID=45351 RepID=UPI0020776FDC|nr:D-aminoacyl-tRNA deacylase 2 [Nematostella vectensis]